MNALHTMPGVFLPYYHCNNEVEKLWKKEQNNNGRHSLMLP